MALKRGLYDKANVIYIQKDEEINVDTITVISEVFAIFIYNPAFHLYSTSFILLGSLQKIIFSSKAIE